MTEAERLAVLEYKVSKLEEMDKKLDELLELRAKGLGAFWLAATLFGTGILGTLGWVLNWFK